MERQTRRSQKPLPKGVRVQIPPRAPRTSNGSPRGAVFRRKRAGRRSRFSSGASWPTESFFRCRPWPSPPRLRASAIGFIPLFPYFAILRSKLREIDAPRHTFQLERLCGRITPGKTPYRPHLNQASRPFPETLRLLRGVYCTKSVSSETKSEPQRRKSRWENLSRPHRYSSYGGSSANPRTPSLASPIGLAA